MNGLKARLGEKELSLEITEAAKEFIVNSGYDAVYGARPLKRYIQANVETLIAKKIIAGDVTENSNLVVDVDNDSLTVKVK